jgi:hypothetical protein
MNKRRRRMPKRLTAAELDDSGPINPDFAYRKLLIEVKIGYPGSVTSDLVIGSEIIKVRNNDVRRAALEAEMDEPKLSAGEPIAYLRDLDGTGSLHVCAWSDPGAIPVYSEA